MLTDRASIAFEEGWQDGIRGRGPEWPNDTAYMAGWRQGWFEYTGKAFDETKAEEE